MRTVKMPEVAKVERKSVNEAMTAALTRIIAIAGKRLGLRAAARMAPSASATCSGGREDICRVASASALVRGGKGRQRKARLMTATLIARSKKHPDEFSSEILDARDRFRQDGVNRPILNFLGRASARLR